MSTAIPKLPFVSNDCIFLLPRSTSVSQTFTRPSYVVPARNCPFGDRAIAQISPALLPSERPQTGQHRNRLPALQKYSTVTYQRNRLEGVPSIRLASTHSPSLDSHRIHCPSNPTLASLRPSRLAARWWQPRRWALESVCTRGKSCEEGVVVVVWTFREDEPEAEMTWPGTTARAKMSVMWAIDCG